MSRFSRYMLTMVLMVYCTAGLAEPDHPLDLKAFSMNLHCFKNDWQLRFNTILATLAREDISVFAFQEVCIGEGQNQAIFLLDKLRELHPGKWTHQLVYTHRGWDRYDEYLMIAARTHDSPSRAGSLPASPLQRGFVAIQRAGTWFVNVHLEYHADNGEFRQQQIEYLVDQFSGLPHIFMGDFNSSPDWDEQRPLHEHGYRPYFPGPTYPATHPDIAIDGFWVSRDLKKHFPDLAVRSMFSSDSTSGVQSDHLGVLMTVKSK